MHKFLLLCICESWIPADCFCWLLLIDSAKYCFYRSSALASRWFCIYACKLFERIPNRLQEVEKMSHVLSYHR